MHWLFKVSSPIIIYIHVLITCRFLADRFVEGICPHCGYEDARGDQCDECSRTLDAIELLSPRCLVDQTHTITTKSSAHMYLKLNEIQARTEEWIKLSWKTFKWSPNAVINGNGEIIDDRLKAGLKPTPVTRDLRWGVPVPVKGEDEHGMKGKVLCKLSRNFQRSYLTLVERCLGAPTRYPHYLLYPDLASCTQFDALIGYPSITANLTPEWKQWWFRPKDTELYQFMGKDNVYFHAIYFPSMELGDGRDWTKVHHISTTGKSYYFPFVVPSPKVLQSISIMREASSLRVKTEESSVQPQRTLVFHRRFGGIILFPRVLKQQTPCSPGRNAYVNDH